MADKEEDRRGEKKGSADQLSAIKKLTDKVKEASENTVGSTRKLVGGVNDAFRATFADSPLIGSIVDIGESMGKDVLSLFKSSDDKDEPITEAEREAAQQRKEQREELKEVTLALDKARTDDLDMGDLLRTDNEQIIDNLQDIKDVWDAGNDAEERREQARRDEERLRLEERRNELLEALNESKDKDDADLGFFEKLKQSLVITATGLVAFLKSPISKIVGFFKPLSGILGKLLRVLGPIAILIGSVIGAFTGFNKATEIFGENASTFEKIASSIGGILSGLTFGLIDIEPLAKGVHSSLSFVYDTFQPFVVSMGEFLGGMWDTLSTGFNLLTSFFNGTPSEIDAAWDAFAGSFTGLGDKFLDASKELAISLFEFLSVIPKMIFEQISKLGGVLGSSLANLFTDDSEGRKLYDRLEDEGGLDDKFIGSDTMSKGDIAKLSNKENETLQKFLLENDKADMNSKIITDLQAQLEKSKREEATRPKEQLTNAIVDASNTNNVTNVNYLKPSARNPDNSMKTSILQLAP